MDRQKQKAVLEAILFTMGESVEISRLASVLETDKKEVQQLLLEMQEKYEESYHQEKNRDRYEHRWYRVCGDCTLLTKTQKE